MSWMSSLLPREPDAPEPIAQSEHRSGALPDNATLIDVRSTAEYMSGHLPGALSMPLPHIEQEIVHKLPLRIAPLILYCASGARSEQALGILKQLGYSDAHNGGGAVQLAHTLSLSLMGGM